MAGNNMNSSATILKSFIVNSLHALCNDHVEFSESIELIGYISVTIDHKCRMCYIVDEHGTKESEDSGTTFFSNSYSCPSSSEKSSTSEHYGDTELLKIPNSNKNCRLKELKTKTYQNNLDCLHNFIEDILINSNVTSTNYPAKSKNSKILRTQSKETVFRSEETNNSSRSELSSTSLDSTSMKNKPFPLDAEPLSSTKKATKHFEKQATPLFSCTEYLQQYKSLYTKSQHPNKQEMMRVFSNLAQKYGVAITIKSARLTSQLVPINKTSSATSVVAAAAPINSVDTGTTKKATDLDNSNKVLQHRSKTEISSRIVKTDNIPDKIIGRQLNRLDGSHTLAFISTETGNDLGNYSMTSSNMCQTLVHNSEYGIKYLDNIVLADSFIPYLAPEVSSTITTLSNQETSEATISSEQESGPVTLRWHEGIPTKESSGCIAAKSRMSCLSRDPNTPSNALLSALAVALVKGERSSSLANSHSVTQEHLRQQPLPKHHRGNYVAQIRKENPMHCQQYKHVSKEDPTQARKRIMATKDPEIMERKSLMNRVLYFRRVNKLPSNLKDKSNSEIKHMSTNDLKKLLPPTKSLKNMDPGAREEWYRLGRSREWRRRKKLLDPEGFKRYNNERAKRYQDNLKKNNPEKYKELRAKGADRLRQYRLSQRMMKAIKEGRETEMPLSSGVKVNNDNMEEFVEVQGTEEQPLVDDNIERISYVISECAFSNGETGTGTDSSCSQSLQSDILDLMYNY